MSLVDINLTSPDLGRDFPKNAQATNGHPLEEGKSPFLKKILQNRTIVSDAKGNFWFRRKAEDPEIKDAEDHDLMAALKYLSGCASVPFHNEKHPVTGDLDALCLPLGKSSSPHAGSIQMFLHQIGCFFYDRKRSQWTREIGEPTRLPDHHDCILAPKPPHPFIKFGALLLEPVRGGQMVHFGLDGLSIDEVEERRTLAREISQNNRNILFHDQTAKNPVTENMANIALFFPDRSPALTAIRALETVFQPDASRFAPKWENLQRQELGRSLVNRVGPDIQIRNQGFTTSVFLPLEKLNGAEQAYLKQFVDVHARSWGISDPAQGIRMGTTKTGVFGLGLQATAMGANPLLGYFQPIAETTSTIGALLTGTRPDLSQAHCAP